jgi:methenyltetrahydromethanopterin cyclohydrolase
MQAFACNMHDLLPLCGAAATSPVHCDVTIICHHGAALMGWIVRCGSNAQMGVAAARTNAAKKPETSNTKREQEVRS